MASSNLHEIESDEDFQREISSVENKLVVIDFHALWCGPCKAIAPKFKEFALQYPGVLFLKVNVDKCQNTSQAYQVSAMPTFVFVHRGIVKAKIRGADVVALGNKIEELSNSLSVTQSLDDDANPVPGMMDLDSLIIERNCLNESEDHPFKWVFEANKDLFLESDCDPELLMSMKFNQVIKLHSIMCQGPPDGHAPKTIKLFINQPFAMDFDSARDATPLQELTLSREEASEGNIVNLRFVKLQNVNNITLFFADNQGDEEMTKIERLILYGKPVNTTNMGDFKRVAGKKGESH